LGEALTITTDDQGVLLCAPPRLFDNVANLRKYLEEEDHPPSLLRLIYACNNEEAVNYLSNAFGISSSSADTGERSFRDWMQDDRDLRRASHKAIRWRPAFDLARGVICTAFGLDFGSLVGAPERAAAAAQKSRVAQSTAALYRQRIAVYMQRAASGALPGPRVTRFNSGSRHLHAMARRDTIIVCEYSSGEAGEIVSANVLLGLNPDLTPRGPTTNINKPLTSSSPNHSAASSASLPTLQAVLSHIVDGLFHLWRDQIALIHEPHAALEDHIYAHPADASCARDVWALSQRLHNMLKLINRHSKVVEAVHDDFRYFAERDGGDAGDDSDDEGQEWLTPLLDDFEVLGENLMTDYLQPLENMIDLVRLGRGAGV
jgi:ribosomal protein S15P/S13E